MNNADNVNALKSFRDILKSNPGAEEAVVNLVNYHAANNEFDECEAILRAAIKSQPGYARFHFMLADQLLLKGYHAEAISNLTFALKQAPNNLHIKIALAQAHGKHGNLDAALDTLLPLLEDNPPDFSAVMIFVNICTPLNMVDDCNLLLEKVSKLPLNPGQRNQLNSVKEMLLNSTL